MNNKLINWGEVSRMLSGSRHTIRKNKVPKIHQAAVNELTKFTSQWIEKHQKKTGEN